MKNKDIYSTALSILAQSNVEGENEDYAERAPFLIAAFCNEVAELDKLARAMLQLPEVQFNCTWLPLDEDFPLIERFASVAAKYLAAMLVVDEDSDLFDRLYDIYCDAISRIREELPSAIENIVNKYL